MHASCSFGVYQHTENTDATVKPQHNKGHIITLCRRRRRLLFKCSARMFALVRRSHAVWSVVLVFVCVLVRKTPLAHNMSKQQRYGSGIVATDDTQIV